MLAAISRNWWVLLLRGLCAVAFGILAFAAPGITLASLIILFAVYAIIDGVTAVSIGIARGAAGLSWWEMIIVGIISVAAGVLTFAWPGLTAVALLALIAAWSIVRGVAEIVAAIRLRGVIQNEWLLIIGGLCSIVFGGLLLARPAAGALAVLWIIGSYAIVFGIITIALSFKLRSLNTNIHSGAAGLT